MKLPNLILTTIFCVFLVAPLGSLALFGADKAVPNRVTVSDLQTLDLFEASDRYRNDILRRMVTTSPVGRGAIAAKSLLDYKMLAFVDTPQILSGLEGWLFYKPSLMVCLTRDEASAALRHAQAMIALSAAAGLDLRMSVSPDKEVVYPEKLGVRARTLAQCKMSVSKTWRELAATMQVPIIDHFAVLEHKADEGLLYFKTDTHWNELGRIKAARQLVKSLTGKTVPMPTGDGSPASRGTDLIRMLRLSDKEDFRSYKGYWSKTFARAVKPGLSGTVIIHDSFYQLAQPELKMIFKDPAFFHYNSPQFESDLREAILAKPHLLLINSVERDFMNHLLRGKLSWSNKVGAGLIELNRQTAEADCAFDATQHPAVTAVDDQANASPESATFAIRLPDSGRPCIRIRYSTPSTSTAILRLPVADTAGDVFPDGFSVELQNNGAQKDFALILPPEFGGREIRFTPVSDGEPIAGMILEAGSARALGAAKP